MNNIRNCIFTITGVLAIIFNFFGIYIMLILTGLLIGYWTALVIIAVLWTLADIWKIRYYKSKGKKFTLSGMSENKS